jgi:hypothetical protein
MSLAIHAEMFQISDALDFTEVEADPSMLDGVTKDCPACDDDNPRAVNRAECQTCNGTGRIGLAAGEIAKELKASKSEQPDLGRASSNSSSTSEEDLYLEY